MDRQFGNSELQESSQTSKNSFLNLPTGPDLQLAHSEGREGQSSRRFENSYGEVSGSLNSMPLAELVIISQSQLKEIRAFTANEIFKVRQQTNKLYKEFEQVKTMRNDMRQVQIEVQIASSNDRVSKRAK